MPPRVATSDGLGEQRADDPAAARANRRANRDLVLARRPLRDHQDRDVRARDEERQHDRGGKDVGQNERHLMADRRALDAEHAHAEVALGSGQMRRVVGEARPQPGLEHRRRLARGPSHDHSEPLVGRQRLRVEPRPDRRVHVREPEALGQDAGDRVRLVVDPDDLPDRVGAPVEEPLPRPVAEDRARGAVGAGCRDERRFPEVGPDAEEREELRRDGARRGRVGAVAGSADRGAPAARWSRRCWNRTCRATCGRARPAERFRAARRGPGCRSARARAVPDRGRAPAACGRRRPGPSA